MARIDEAASPPEELLCVAEGAYSTRTLKGYAADLRIFSNWCAAHSCDWLPAAADTLRRLCRCSGQGALYFHHQTAVVRHRICAPPEEPAGSMDHNVVLLAVRRASRLKTRRPKQVRGLTRDILSKIVAACPDTMAGLRDAALIRVGYDTLCRSSELAMMDVQHVQFAEDGIATILVPRSKSDIAGDGRVAYLWPETTALLARWLEAAELQNGPLFRALHLSRPYGEALETSSIRRLIKRATHRAGLDPIVTAALSGHSMRVGAAQDMLVAGFNELAIMQAGGWKSPHVLLRYVEHAATRDLHERRWRSSAE